jgi:inosine/xanthosine triphosphate pyrophosphatase family protein
VQRRGVLIAMTIRLYFATSSEVKFRQYAYIAEDHGISIVRGTVVSDSLTEPQGSSSDIRDMSNLVFHPLRLSARFVSSAGQIPYFVEDTMLIINAISNHRDGHIGLPGPDTKNWWLNLGAQGVLKLLRDVVDRSARYVCQIGIFFGAGHYSYYQAETQGFITGRESANDEAFKTFPKTNPYFFHSIFGLTPEGPTLADLNSEEFSKYDYRRACFGKTVAELRRFEETEQFERSLHQLVMFE